MEGQGVDSSPIGPKERGEGFPIPGLGRPGVAGHAGLFSTARDLGVWCRMILGEGRTTVDGRLEMFDDAIRKLLWPEKRLEHSSYNGATPERHPRVVDGAERKSGWLAGW